MSIDIFSSAGKKTGTRDIPAALLEETINKGLIHQAVLMQAANAKTNVAHVKKRDEVVGSNKKLFQQKGTGNARRGPLRSPVMRGGGKAWGPRNLRTFERGMPKAMRHAAVRASISLQAKHGGILGLESYGSDIKTKVAHQMMKALPVELGRRIVVVLPEKMNALEASVRNIPGVQTLLASYLNPRDIVGAKHLIFVGDALEKAEAIFGKKKAEKVLKATETASESEEKPAKKTAAKKSAPKKASKKSA